MNEWKHKEVVTWVSLIFDALPCFRKIPSMSKYSRLWRKVNALTKNLEIWIDLPAVENTCLGTLTSVFLPFAYGNRTDMYLISFRSTHSILSKSSIIFMAQTLGVASNSLKNKRIRTAERRACYSRQDTKTKRCCCTFAKCPKLLSHTGKFTRGSIDLLYTL